MKTKEEILKMKSKKEIFEEMKENKRILEEEEIDACMEEIIKDEAKSLKEEWDCEIICCINPDGSLCPKCKEQQNFKKTHDEEFNKIFEEILK